ncbi:MAG: large subunit ribosomal protein L14 [Candidatus Berkelbacteria bacterium Licking1014_85]|uniref:Large ribosomal subunit protein uL14 n=1 Tax=Candidatus Berkelbacteria bacterium Licking1014_85 TaxID=2017148 RepID=A0A554LM09_9BACT|nr:MAG: large subunit ribosomal protein L14 [Candidatus Berkelbacteria bacterium Licking1014_85]
MIIQYTTLKIADNTGAKTSEVIQVYGQKRVATLGSIVLVAIKSAAPNGMVKKKEMAKAVIVRQKNNFQRANGITIRFSENAAVLINADKTPRGTRIIGPVASELREKGFQKIISLAPEVL